MSYVPLYNMISDLIVCVFKTIFRPRKKPWKFKVDFFKYAVHVIEEIKFNVSFGKQAGFSICFYDERGFEWSLSIWLKCHFFVNIKYTVEK